MECCLHSCEKKNTSESFLAEFWKNFGSSYIWYISWCSKLPLPITLTLLKSTLLQSLVTSGLRSCALDWVWGRISWPVNIITTQNTSLTDLVVVFLHPNYPHLQLKQSMSILPVRISQSSKPPSILALQWRNIVMNRYKSVQITTLKRKRERESSYYVLMLCWGVLSIGSFC